MKKINIRKFSRGLYSYLDKLPLVVYNKRTNKIMFVVISEKKGKEIYAELQTDNIVQPKR